MPHRISCGGVWVFPVALTGDVDKGEDLTRCLAPLIEMLDSHGVSMTIPVTSGCLEKFQQSFRLLQDYGHEIAGHGDVHKPFLEPFEVQVTRLQTMKDEFQRHLGVQPRGFRAPYLSHNPDTYRALAATGFQYDSSRVCRDPLIYLRARFGLARAYPARWRHFPGLLFRYGLGRTASKPSNVHSGLLELPVFELDDWFFLDAAEGPRLSPEQALVITEHWLTALRDFRRTGATVFVIQAHPLRMHRGLLKAVDMFLSRARAAGCTFMTLSEIHALTKR